MQFSVSSETRDSVRTFLLHYSQSCQLNKTTKEHEGPVTVHSRHLHLFGSVFPFFLFFFSGSPMRVPATDDRARAPCRFKVFELFCMLHRLSLLFLPCGMHRLFCGPISLMNVVTFLSFVVGFTFSLWSIVNKANVYLDFILFYSLATTQRPCPSGMW